MPPKTEVSDIVDRRNESRRYYQANYWDEWEEAVRSTKCRTKPIMVKNSKGEDAEDTSRTNVCMPTLAFLRRRKTARLTANAPQIDYKTASGNKDVEEKLTAKAYQDYDRSGEAWEHRRVVDSGVTFGVGYSKTIYDTIEIMRRIRKPINSFQDRQSLMEFQGKNPEEIDQAVQTYGTQLDDDLIKQLMKDSLTGNDIQGRENVIKYEGPVVKNVFVGDLFLEPGCRVLNESAWVVESYYEDDRFLQKMLRKRFIDPDTQEERPIFDLKACEEAFDTPTPNVANTSQQPFDLRTRLRTASMSQTIPIHPSKLVPGKRLDILESHQRDEYGMMWISWIANEKVLLGKMPYPWDLYGKTVYSEFVPMPDILNCIGDSSIRLLRWVHQLHNITVGQRKDLVSAILRPLVLQRLGEDVPDEAIERALFRVIQVKDLNSFKPFVEPPSVGQAISAGMEEEGQLLRMMNLFEPFNNTDTGSESNPQAGKTATTAVLAAKSADALTQFEIDGLNLYLKDVGEKKLWMNQQAMTEPAQISPQYAAKVSGLSQRYGKTSALTLDPMEIQEDIQVEPSAMSMLAVDDELKRNAAMQFYQFAAQDPITFNKPYAAEFLAGTIRGIDPAKAINPPAPPPPPPTKTGINVSVKFEMLPPEAQVEVLQECLGKQLSPQTVQAMAMEHTVAGVNKLSEAADSAHNLMTDGTEEQEPGPKQALSAAKKTK